MAILVGATGFVGGHLARSHEFAVQVHRPNIDSIRGMGTDLLVCAGLPAEKWRANREPSEDWRNMSELAQVLASVSAERAVLISTVDVYQPALGVDESDPPNFSGSGAYGAHRAWFEAFFASNFVHTLVLRLPALFAADVRKNLVHDLLHRRSDQFAQVNPASTFQFFDVTRTWALVERSWELELNLLNVTSEPVRAEQIASLFGVELTSTASPVAYDMRSVHASHFGGRDGYLVSSEAVLGGIADLRTGVE